MTGEVGGGCAAGVGGEGDTACGGGDVSTACEGRGGGCVCLVCRGSGVMTSYSAPSCWYLVTSSYSCPPSSTIS